MGCLIHIVHIDMDWNISPFPTRVIIYSYYYDSLDWFSRKQINRKPCLFFLPLNMVVPYRFSQQKQSNEGLDHIIDLVTNVSKATP